MLSFFIFIFISIFLLGSYQPAETVPDTLTLEYCYTRVENHYPLVRKIELQKEITKLNKKIAGTAYYPQLNFGATATYQSEVTEFQVPAGGQPIGPDLSKDQYKITMDVTQSIYNGGAVDIQKNLEDVHGRKQQQEIKVQLHQLKQQVNQVYFGILLAKQQLEIVRSLAENLRSQIKSVQSKVENGVVLPAQQYILEAELVKTGQDSAAIQANVRSGYEVMTELIGEELNPGVNLKTPESEPAIPNRDTAASLRPEFGLFESNRRALIYQKELVQTNKTPSLSAFGTAAYGRPGFNVFENDLHEYFIVGLKLQWNFWSAHNAGTRQQVYDLQVKSINEEERAFERQLAASLAKIREDIQALEDQIKRDEEIITLREKVVAVVSSQMKNGTATATEYITELNKTTQARLSMMMHKTRLEQAKVDYKTLLGVQDINR